MKILFLTQLFPYPPICGGTIKSWNILKRLCARHNVTLAAFVRGNQDQKPQIVDIYRAVHCVRIHRSGTLNVKFAVESLLRQKSFIILRDYVQEMQELVDELAEREHFDVVYADHLQMAQYVRREHAPCLILDEHNVEWRILKRLAATSSGLRKVFAEQESRKLRAFEISACSRFDQVITVTEEDRIALLDDNPDLDNVDTVPIGVDLEEFRPVRLDPGSQTILSLGTMSWPPNVDAILYFTNEIYPLVKQAVPNTNFVIAGSRPPGSIQALSSIDRSITVTGYVPDVSSLAAQATAFIVPLRSGSGMRVKIINALAMGLPVVTTSIGCEGIDAVNERDLLIADDPPAFADAVIRLLNDTKLRSMLGESGRRLVEQKYSWEAIYPRLDVVVEKLMTREVKNTLGNDGVVPDLGKEDKAVQAAR